MSNHHMSAWHRAGVLALTLALGAIAVVPALAAKPIREQISVEPTLLDAGLGCAFPVEFRPQEGSHFTRTEFTDRTVIQSSAHTTVTNLESGASIEANDFSLYSERYDAQANDLLIDVSGQTILYFFPGDQGPDGEVGENGALYAVVGRVQETLDLDQDLITSFALQGQAKELCSLLD
jgi:hypothetical protein